MTSARATLFILLLETAAKSNGRGKAGERKRRRGPKDRLKDRVEKRAGGGRGVIAAFFRRQREDQIFGTSPDVVMMREREGEDREEEREREMKRPCTVNGSSLTARVNRPIQFWPKKTMFQLIQSIESRKRKNLVDHDNLRDQWSQLVNKCGS